VNASSEITDRIARFLHCSEKPRPWVNPFHDLQLLSPQFFREGSAHWQDPPEWTPAIAWAFSVFHGPLMEELGYWDAASMPSSVASSGEMRAMARDLLETLDNRQVLCSAISRSKKETRRVRAILKRSASSARLR
jgi:hypothetical protein